jgi:hypothetical protein
MRSNQRAKLTAEFSFDRAINFRAARRIHHKSLCAARSRILAMRKNSSKYL